MTPGDGDLRARKDAAPCSRRLPRPPAPRSDPAGSARHRGEAGAGPRSCTSRTGPAAERAPRPPVPLCAPPPAASRFLLLAQRKRRHVGAGAAGRAQPGRHYRRFPVRGLGMGVSWCVPPLSPHTPPSPAGQASRESQALFLARALPTAGTPAGQDALTQPGSPAPPSPHPGDTGDTAPDPRLPPGPPGHPARSSPPSRGAPALGSPQRPPPGFPDGTGRSDPLWCPGQPPGSGAGTPVQRGGPGARAEGGALRPA